MKHEQQAKKEYNYDIFIDQTSILNIGRKGIRKPKCQRHNSDIFC